VGVPHRRRVGGEDVELNKLSGAGNRVTG